STNGSTVNSTRTVPAAWRSFRSLMTSSVGGSPCAHHPPQLLSPHRAVVAGGFERLVEAVQRALERAVPVLFELVASGAHPGRAAERTRDRAHHRVDRIDLALEGRAELLELLGVGAVQAAHVRLPEGRWCVPKVMCA